MDTKLAQSVTEGIKDAVQPEGSLVIKVKQTTGLYVDSIVYTGVNDIREIDFMQKLGAPASFMRIQTTQTCRLDVKNWSERTNENIKEWKQDPEGITALLPRLYYDENLELIRVIPTAYPCTIRIWASKKGKQNDFLR